MIDLRLHNDCDGGACWACAEDARRARGKRCDTCFWWLRDSLSDGEGLCRRYRPSCVEVTAESHVCREHRFDNPYWTQR